MRTFEKIIIFLLVSIPAVCLVWLLGIVGAIEHGNGEIWQAVPPLVIMGVYAAAVNYSVNK